MRDERVCDDWERDVRVLDVCSRVDRVCDEREDPADCDRDEDEVRLRDELDPEDEVR